MLLSKRELIAIVIKLITMTMYPNIAIALSTESKSITKSANKKA